MKTTPQSKITRRPRPSRAKPKNAGHRIRHEYSRGRWRLVKVPITETA